MNTARHSFGAELQLHRKPLPARTTRRLEREVVRKETSGVVVWLLPPHRAARLSTP
jgi:hypothetical protein